MAAQADLAQPRLALLIATSDYTDPALRQLRAPGRDASGLAEVLSSPQIGGFDTQTLINARCGELLEAIEDFCADRRLDDQLLIYLSCHGVLDDRGRLYYAATDTRRQRTAATAVAAAWLNERLDDCRARSQIVILDCCHSGAFASGAKGDSVLALEQRFQPQGRGRIVLTASRGTEYSFEGDQPSGKGMRSVFTQAIVDGLRTGDADLDKDGLITVSDIYHYAHAKVRAAEPRQTPELWTYGAEGDLLFAHSPRGPVIEPAPLPEDLRLTLENPRPVVRESGVRVLADLVDHAEPGLALTARLTLQRISEEDLPRIAVLARAAHDAGPGQAVTQLEVQERARREAEEQARRQEAERAAAQRQQQIQQLQAQMRDHAAAQDWDAVLTASDQLAALDPAAADPDGLASTAREQITRRQEAERAAAQRQQQIQQLQAQMRDHAATRDWDAVLAVGGRLAALDPAAADPGGLASTAREQITRRQQAERANVRPPDAADDRSAALDELFRSIADAQGLTEADLRVRLTGWSDNAVGAYLSGARQPGWNFVTAFLDVVTEHNPGLREVLERRLRPVWEATARPAVRRRSVWGVIGVAIAVICLITVILIVAFHRSLGV